MKRVWLINIRNELGLTQEKVAEVVGIARTTYAMYEQNQRTPSVSTAVKIGDALNFDWQLFFEIQLHDTRKKLA